MVCIVLLALVLTHPWWLSAVIGHVLAREGVEVEEVNVRGYGAVEWSGLHWEIEGNRMEAERIVVALPLTWLITLHTGRPPGPAVLGEALVRLEDWSLDLGITERERREAVEPEVMLPELARQIHSVLETVRRVLPTAVAKRGNVRGGSMEWAVPEVSWRDGVFTVEGGEAMLPGLANFNAAARMQREGIDLRARSLDPSWPWRVDAVVETEENRLVARGAFELDDLLWKGAVVWESAGWIPDEAEATVRGEGLPAAAAKQLEDWRLHALDATAVWKAPAAWTFTGSGSGEWREPETGAWIPWSGEAAGSGDLEKVTLSSASVDLPFLLADLSAPVSLHLADLALAEAVRADVVADLSRFPVHAVDARFQGSVTLSPIEEGGVRVGASGALSGDWEGTAAGADVILDARIDRTRAEVGRLRLDASHGSGLEASGGFVFAEGRVEGAEVSFHVNRRDVLPFFTWAEELPERVEGEIRGHGVWPGTEHEGFIRSADVSVPAMHPFDIHLRWTGRGIDHFDAAAELRRGEHRLGAEANVVFGESGVRATFETLFVEDEPDRRVFDLLDEPRFAVEAGFDGDGTWQVRWSALEAALFSPRRGAGAITLEAGWFGGESFSVAGLGAENLDPFWITTWLDVDLMDAHASALALNASTDARGRVQAAGTMDVQGTRGDERFGVSLTFDVEADAARIADATAYRDGLEVFRAAGVLPLAISWRGNAFAGDLDMAGALDFELRADGRSALADLLATHAGTMVTEPVVQLRVGGTLAAPTGRVEASAEAVERRAPGFDEPFLVRDVRLRVNLAEERAEIEEARFALPGVPEAARLTGGVSDISWDDVFAGDFRAVLDGLRGEVALDAFPFTALAGLFPDLFEPRGNVEGLVRFSPGPRMEGRMRLRGVSLRPFEDGSTLRDIDADVVVDGFVFEFRDMRALWNGRPVTFKGEADLSEWPVPLFSFEAQGERLDLVRRDDMLLRADVALRVVRADAASAPRVEGAVTMRSSLFLQDFRDILRPGATGVETRPPYFSVSRGPFNEWELDVDLRGEDFMRIQSTLLRGRLSADFSLGGTLGEPLAVGEARLSNAAVIFPFGRIDLSQAEALVTLDQPHSLQLFAQGSGHSFGYTVTFLLRGTAARPVMELSSVPPLGQEAILMLLATGAVPDQEGGLASRSGRVALYFGQDILSLLLAGEGGENIRIRTGQSSTQFGAEAMGIEYRISDRYSIIGEYNEFENYSIDFKWRVLRR